MPQEESQKICPICGKEIAETEETAVCPDCSQKYHKACFSQSGGCVNPGCPGAKPAADTAQNTPETAPQNEPAAAPQSAPITCPQCGAAITPGTAFCPSCGHPTEENPPQSAPANCPKCGAAITPGTAFCPSCGQKISEARPKKKHKALVPILISGVLILGVAAAVIFLIPFVKSVELSENKLKMKQGANQAVTCDVTVLNPAKAKVKWESSDESIAKVDDSGKIEAVGDGTCKITASCGGKNDSLDVTVTTGPDFNEVFSECGLESPWAEVGIDGSYLSIDTNPHDRDDYIEYDAYVAIGEVNTKLGFSESTTRKMNYTTAIEGLQSDTNKNGDVTVSWKYHPDNGLEVTYESAS